MERKVPENQHIPGVYEIKSKKKENKESIERAIPSLDTRQLFERHRNSYRHKVIGLSFMHSTLPTNIFISQNHGRKNSFNALNFEPVPVIA